MQPIIIDVASAPIEGAADYIDIAEPAVPGSYKKAESIAEWIAEERPKLMQQAKEKALAHAALDMDLARLTAVGILEAGKAPVVYLCRDENDERAAIVWVKSFQPDYNNTVPLCGYNIFGFDLPLVMRRARYLGVTFPRLNLDRYRSPHSDLMLELSDRDPQRRRPLSFYAKRLGMEITKTLSGAEEARVHETGLWDELAESVKHDLVAAGRLAEWLNIIDPKKAVAA